MSGSLVWLSAGQWMTLLWLRQRMRHGQGETTLVHLAAATGTHPGAVTHRLDRLAQLGLIGRHSRVGRGHRTRFWPPKRAATARSWQPSGNVATSTAYGGPIRAYVSRGGVIRDALRGGAPPSPPAGGDPARPARRRPPRQLYERCPRDGARVTLTAWRFRLTSSRVVGLWDGPCSSCGALVLAPLVLEAADRSSIADVGRILESIPIQLVAAARPAARRRSTPPAIPPGPRLDRIRELAAEIIAGGDVDADQAGILGARWLGWRPERIPQPPIAAVDAGDVDAARAEAWAGMRDWRPVRYSQPEPPAIDAGLIVRDSQPPAGDVDD